MKVRLTSTAAIVAIVATPSFATDTVKYTYDALGRLSTSADTAGSAATVTATMTYDKAGNRTQYKVAGSTVTPPTPGNGITMYAVHGGPSVSGTDDGSGASDGSGGDDGSGDDATSDDTGDPGATMNDGGGSSTFGTASDDDSEDGTPAPPPSG